jgi:phosphorylcholine metabolism protein LicD
MNEDDNLDCVVDMDRIMMVISRRTHRNGDVFRRGISEALEDDRMMSLANPLNSYQPTQIRSYYSQVKGEKIMTDAKNNKNKKRKTVGLESSKKSIKKLDI